MSRIIVKNLPKNIKEDRVRDTFGALGSMTDCSLKYTKDGVFRRFAFIGYATESQAQEAVTHFNQTFIDTSRLQVEIARELGDGDKPRAWSKYSQDSSAYQQKHQTKKSPQKESPKKDKDAKEKKRQERVDELLGDLKEDAEFQQFLEVNKAKSTKALWGNDDLASSSKTEYVETEGEDKRKSGGKKKDSETEKPDLDEESDSGMSSDEATEEVKEKKKKKRKKPEKGEQTNVEEASAANTKQLSDLEYLQSKVSKTNVFSDSESDSESDSDSESGGESVSTDASSREEKEESGTEEIQESDPAQKQYKYLVKMKGIPANVKIDQIEQFFKPIKVKNVKIPHSKASNAQSIVTVEFTTKSDQEDALRRNKNFIGPKRIFLHKLTEEIVEEKEKQPRRWELSKDNTEEETIAESGRLYIRNLAYTCKEEDIESLFAKYGTLAEVHLPIDTFTKKVKGFAFVTFMFPEHAVQAYSDLDGKSWQGRILHILPAKAKKSEGDDVEGETSYKKKKEAEKKASAGSSHNWNTLFLGSNAVVDVMADQYATAKSNILGVSGGKESIGVRLALGETQVVAETRSFLVEHGVVLDAFSKAGTERSKTVILVKNLPAKTKAEELKEIFGRHGTLGRLVLPPSGVSAIVEFAEPTEARTAFRSLAYTKFQHVPLYLEWAPMDVFSTPPPTQDHATTSHMDEDDGDDDDEAMEGTSKKDNTETVESDPEDADEPSEGCTLFVKNLNFDTEDQALKDAFAKCGKVKSATVAKKKDVKHPGQLLSMGYGFVEYVKKESAQKALKTLQHTKLDGHQLELKLSHRAQAPLAKSAQKGKGSQHKQKATTKILVRNLPFEAKQSEVKELFAVFGELKMVRLPRKLSGTGQHRGFGFVDFLSKEDAKGAFNALCHSTHLYGRRLVLEWAAEDENVDELRLRTASRFHHGQGPPNKKLKKASLMDELKMANPE